MSYIGSTPTSQNFISGTDYFNGTGSQTAFTLTRSVNSVNDVEVVVNNVIQQPSSYTVSGTTLTLSAAPSSGTSNVYVRYLATNQQSFTVGNNTVGYNQLTADMQSKFAMKNRIINGDMRIDQRNAGASVAAPTDNFITDRFSVREVGGGVASAQQVSTAPTGFVNSLKLTVTTADSSIAATDRYFVRQPIEGVNTSDLGFGTSTAKTFTLSFWVQSSVTGTYPVAFRNNANTRSYVATYTISAANTWEQKTITVAGDTTGTWVTTSLGTGINVVWTLGAGSTYNTTANAWQTGDYLNTSATTQWIATNAATFYITGVQLEVGSSATGFEYRQYQQELALCQRYYQSSCPIGIAPADGSTSIMTAGSAFNVSSVRIPWIPFVVQMRVTPTVTLYRSPQTATAGQWATYDSTVWTAGTTTSVTDTSASGLCVDVNRTSAFTAKSSYLVTGVYVASSEL